MTIDGVVVTELGTKADLAIHDVRVDGLPVQVSARRYYIALNKPPGFVCTREDTHDRSTVMDLLPEEMRHLVYPVGRLDYNSRGLLLLTNDGELANRLIHPRYHVPKKYLVTIAGTPTEAALQRLRAGVEIEEGVTVAAQVRVMPARVRRDAVSPRTVLEFIIREGKKRQIRRMCEVVGHEVLDLRRSEFGSIKLGVLSEGQWRELLESEVATLRQAAGLGGEE